MKKIEYYALVKKVGDIQVEKRSGYPITLHGPDGRHRMYCAFSRVSDKLWVMTELYTGLNFVMGSTKQRMLDQTAAMVDLFFGGLDKYARFAYFDKYHETVIQYYPEAIVIDSSLRDELSAYMYAPSFMQAIDDEYCSIK